MANPEKLEVSEGQHEGADKVSGGFVEDVICGVHDDIGRYLETVHGTHVHLSNEGAGKGTRATFEFAEALGFTLAAPLLPLKHTVLGILRRLKGSDEK